LERDERSGDIFIVVLAVVGVVFWIKFASYQDNSMTHSEILIAAVMYVATLIGKIIGFILGALLIYYLGGCIIEFIRKVYVAWIKTSEWTKDIDEQMNLLKDKIQDNKTDLYWVQNNNRELESIIEVLKKELKEIKSFTGLKEKQATDDAESEITGANH
jgi:hypothetical protein